MDMEGNQRLLSNEEMGFSYRNSRIQQENGIVMFADFVLEPQPEVAIRAKMQELMAKRCASQPLDLPSAGSAFKRPAVGYAAAMIDQAGLKGFQIGGAAVSEKHAGFVVNLGGATAADVRALLKAVAKRVYEFHGVLLEPEVRIW
jgi:UDP-N-acetylmuramate dehydrogenase